VDFRRRKVKAKKEIIREVGLAQKNICIIYSIFQTLVIYFFSAGLELRVQHMQGKCSTTELHLQPQTLLIVERKCYLLFQEPRMSSSDV
jgi:hypothetical protein